MKKSILIIDDEARIQSSLKEILEDEGFEVFVASDGYEGLKIADEDLPDLVLLDIWMPGIDGIEVLSKLRENLPQIQVIMISGHGTVETAVKATRLGAYDFIEKPLSLEKVILTVNNALSYQKLEEENRLLQQMIDQGYQITGNSKRIRELREQAKTIAPADAWVVIYGENGTGKELLARAIHRQSRRADKPFIEVNCSAIPPDLMENELFGYEKGAFAGAVTKKRGKLDLANEGTLLLDKIGDLPLQIQGKLLSILQEHKFERAGGNRSIDIDVRVIATSTQDLKEKVKGGNFREDLYYLINVVPLHVPPLKERKEDILLLVEEFLKRYSLKNSIKPKTISPEALEKLKKYDWPGNVRELKNLIERLVILSEGSEITASDIPPSIAGHLSTKGKKFLDSESFQSARNDFERQFIVRKLLENNKDIDRTAEAIGIAKKKLNRKLKDLKIEITKLT
ncbi:MAG: sigma-54 dependent transcriptional regulator [Proteobacteria bacterium]|nr:sigma-54 dependent transcriptional regulator [Pseudomonadota bacterium]